MSLHGPVPAILLVQVAVDPGRRIKAMKGDWILPMSLPLISPPSRPQNAKPSFPGLFHILTLPTLRHLPLWQLSGAKALQATDAWPLALTSTPPDCEFQQCDVSIRLGRSQPQASQYLLGLAPRCNMRLQSSTLFCGICTMKHNGTNFRVDMHWIVLLPYSAQENQRLDSA